MQSVAAADRIDEERTEPDDDDCRPSPFGNHSNSFSAGNYPPKISSENSNKAGPGAETSSGAGPVQAATDARISEPELTAECNSLHVLGTRPRPSHPVRTAQLSTLAPLPPRSLCNTAYPLLHPQAHGRWLVLILLLSPRMNKHAHLCDCHAAIYTVYTSPTHPPIPNHLPTLIVTPHGMCNTYTAFYRVSHTQASHTGQPANILYSYLHTNYVRIRFSRSRTRLISHG